MSRRVFIVDDEPLARARLIRFVSELGGYDICGEAENGQLALDACAELEPDIVLMDIRMPVMDGMQAAQQLSQQATPPAIIFCTAYEEYALAAFDTSAVAYLLKPVRRERLTDALARAVSLTRAQTAVLKGLTENQTAAHLTARSRGGLERIPLGEVRCFLADQKYVTVVHAGGELLIDQSLKELEAEFGQRFVRVHRNALVSVGHIEALERGGDGQYSVSLTDTQVRPQVSRRHLAQVRELLQSL